MDVTFHRAADAFLYLPLYIAEQRGIIQNIDETINPIFKTPTDSRGKKGDIIALQQVLEESKFDKSIPIAVCDPSAIFDSSLTEHTFNFRVLGSLITKLPFWAIDGLNNVVVKEDALRGKFENIIYYDERLRTGNFIGKLTKSRARIPDVTPVEFGQEFNLILKKEYDKTLTVTADIIALALSQDHPIKKLSINHHYSKNSHYQNFITTALITTESVYTKFGNELEKILEGIQYALAVLLSSKRTAKSVCTAISKEKDFYHQYHEINPTIPADEPKLTPKQIDYIIDRIYEGNFYSENLKITKERWDETINCHLKTVIDEPEIVELLKEGKRQYEKIVTNKLLINSQRRFIKNLGINIDEINEEITLQKINAEKTIIQETFESEKQSLIKALELEKQSFASEKQSLTKSAYIGSSLLTTSIFGLTFFFIGILTPVYQIFSQSLLPYLGLGLFIMFPAYAIVVRYVLPKVSLKDTRIWLVILAVLLSAVGAFILWLGWKTTGDELTRYTVIGGIFIAFGSSLGFTLLPLAIQQSKNDSK